MPKFNLMNKQESIICLLKSETGTTMIDLMTTTSWQRHSVQGFLSTLLKKYPKVTLVTERFYGKPRKYRLGGDVSVLTKMSQPENASDVSA